MSRWTLDVLRSIYPKHLVKAIFDPKRAVRELKYRYTFTSKIRFPVDLLGIPKKNVSELFEELAEEESFLTSVNESLELRQPGPGRFYMTREADLLYVVVRLMKPDVVVETGVGAGKSSAFILKAMQKNGKGVLHSIDLPDEKQSSGWIVQDDLRSRWNLLLGTSEDILDPLLQEVSPIDIFLHDSNHSYENMIFEFTSAWPALKSNGMLLAHDVGRNDSLFDFCRQINYRWTKVRTFHVLAGLKKS